MLVCFPKERVTRWEKRSNGRKRTPGRTQASRCGRRRACEGEAVVKKGVWRDGTSAWGAAVESGSRGPDAEPSGGSGMLEATGWGDKEPEASLRGTARGGSAQRGPHTAKGQCRCHRELAQIGPHQTAGEMHEITHTLTKYDWLGSL